jgi:hypothetical protein
MPFLRRGRRRPPFWSSRWQQRTLPSLRLHLAPTVRTALTAWMKIYGETNNLPGLATGPIEVRFRRLREHAGADTLLLWTTPERWSAGEALSLWIPAIGVDLECRFDDGKLAVERARPTTDEDRDPRRVRSAVGIELRPERVELPPPDQNDEPNGAMNLEGAFERLVGRRWSGFVAPLREALEAEARDDAARSERLATEYATATPRIGGPSESDPYRLSGVEASACAAFDEGEWLDLLDTRGRVISSARLVHLDPAEGTLDVDVRGADPPSTGTVRPRPQTQIFAQKRAILEELDNPTGGLRDAVRLVASPASLPPLAKRRPASFVNRMIVRNRSQVRAVSLALGLNEGQALMIQGPPGTGKSTTLAEIIGQLVLRDPNATVLVCSHSNHGVDNLLLKTLPYLDAVPELAIARVGLFDRVHPEARAHFVAPGEDLGAYNVVFTTVDALALQVEAGARTYDYAVLDEANRASILDSLIPLVRGRRFILVGDHLQLQPVLSDAEEQLRLEPAVARSSAIGKSLFAWLRERRFPEAATVFLDEQNRMHPVIAGLISEVFYDGRLRSGPRAPRRSADVPIFPASVTWVDTRGLHGLREARGRGASLMNVPEARLVATIARHVMGTTSGELDVGVIAAYAEQTALLRRILRGSGVGSREHVRVAGFGDGGRRRPSANSQLPAPSSRSLEIDTVDAFEGREKDVVIVSLVRSNRRRDIGFLRLMQRINVALSRARRLLIIVGDASTLRGSYFDRIIRYVRANGMMVPGPRLIGRLLNARSAEREGGARPARRRRGAPRLAIPRDDARLEAPPATPNGPTQDDGSRIPLPPRSGDGAERRGRRRRRRGRRRFDTARESAPRAELGNNGQPLDAVPDTPSSDREDRGAAASTPLTDTTSPPRFESLVPTTHEPAAPPSPNGESGETATESRPAMARPRRTRRGVAADTNGGENPAPEAPPAEPETAAAPPRRTRRRVTAPAVDANGAPPEVMVANAEAVTAPPRRTRRRTAVESPEGNPPEALASEEAAIARPKRTRRRATSETGEEGSSSDNGASPEVELAIARPRRTRRLVATEAPEPDPTA